MSQLKKGAILSYLTIILTNGIGLIITPFIVSSLGNAEYGLYNLIGAFIGYMAVLDLGLNNTIVRYVAKYRAENDNAGEANFLATTMYIYSILTIILLIIGICSYFNLENIFSESLTDQEIETAKIMFLILLLNIAITIPGNSFEAICSGYEEFVYPKKMRMIRYVVRTLAVLGLLFLNGGAIGLVIIDTLMNITIIASNAFFVINKLKVKFKLNYFNKNLIKEIFTYSFWIFLMGIVYQFQWRAGQVILGISTDTVTVAIFAIGILLGTYYSTFATTITSLLIPKAMKLVVANATGIEITGIAIKIGRVLLFLLYLILGGFAVFGKEFVVLWVGSIYTNAWVIALIIMFTLTNSLIQSFLTSILKAKNLYKFKSLTYITFVLLGLILGYYMISFYREIGLIIGLCIGIIFSQIILNIYYVFKLGFKILDFYLNTFLKPTTFLLLFLLYGFLLNLIFSDYTWISLLIKIFIFTLTYAVVNYFFIFNEVEKNMILGLKNKLFLILKLEKRL